jgi:hypothetical protein
MSAIRISMIVLLGLSLQTGARAAESPPCDLLIESLRHDYQLRDHQTDKPKWEAAKRGASLLNGFAKSLSAETQAMIRALPKGTSTVPPPPELQLKLLQAFLKYREKSDWVDCGPSGGWRMENLEVKLTTGADTDTETGVKFKRVTCGDGKGHVDNGIANQRLDIYQGSRADLKLVKEGSVELKSSDTYQPSERLVLRFGTLEKEGGWPVEKDLDLNLPSSIRTLLTGKVSPRKFAPPALNEDESVLEDLKDKSRKDCVRAFASTKPGQNTEPTSAGTFERSPQRPGGSSVQTDPPATATQAGSAREGSGN